MAVWKLQLDAFQKQPNSAVTQVYLFAIICCQLKVITHANLAVCLWAALGGLVIMSIIAVVTLVQKTRSINVWEFR